MSETETALRRLSESNADLTGGERDFLVSAADEFVSLKRQLAAAESRLAEAVGLLYQADEFWYSDHPNDSVRAHTARRLIRAFLSEPAARQEEKHAGD